MTPLDPSPAPASGDDEIDLIEYARIFWRHRMLVLVTAASATVVAIALAFVTPKVYQVEASVLPGTDSGAGGMLAGLASQLGPAAGMIGDLGGGRAADLVEILSSRSMAERVISRVRLDKKLDGWKYHSQLVAELREMVAISGQSLKSKLVTIQVEAADPKLAADIANAYVDELKVMLDEMGYNSATKNLRFVKQQLDKSKEELVKAEEALATFQSINQLSALPEAVVSSMQSVSDFEAQRINAEVQLKMTEESLSEMRTKVSSLQADPNSLIDLELKRKALAAQQAALSKAKDGFVARMATLPPKGMQLARLTRDVQVQNAIYLALRQQYEAATISENKESNAFLPLDRAIVPDLPIKPRKRTYGFIGLISGLVLGMILAVLREYYRAKESQA